MPVTAPSTLGLRNLIHSMHNQVKAPADADKCVTSIAIPALPSAANALPALNPYQPTHNIPAPVTVIVMLCGGMAVSGKPRRGPSTSAPTSAAAPAVICTTVPP